MDSTLKKAELIAHDVIYIPPNIKLPHPLDKSSAGPAAGSPSIALAFDNKRVKMRKSQNPKELFSLQREEDRFVVKKKGETFLKVNLIPLPSHAPDQVFVNLESRCIYKCSFCTLRHKINFELGRFILRTLQRYGYKSVALTSGVFPDNEEVIRRMCTLIKEIKRKDISIGVEVCIEHEEEIVLLKQAGANEIKINLNIPNIHLFKKICPDLDYSRIMSNLKKAVEVFGRGRVTSNLIYGLGESDNDLIKALEELATIGVVPTLRKIRIDESNKEKLERSLSYKLEDVPSNRILRIACIHKKILEKYNLTTKTFKTMCHKCGCCDMVPFWDV